MERNKDNTNRSFWEKFAFIYSPFMRQNRKQYLAVYDDCKKYLSEEMSVLEIACGTGQFSAMLAKDVKSLQATDFSAKMVKGAKKKIKAENVNFSVQDATELGYGDGTFDGVFIANALHIMPDPARALSEILRVLKSDGLLFAPTFVYDGVENSRKIRMMEKFGFRTFHRWKSGELSDYVAKAGFGIADCKTVAGKLLPECILIARKKR